jgi:putative oxidoreductase
MSMTRVLARPLLSSMFIVGGIDALRHPEGKVKAAEPVTKEIASRLPVLPQETETLVRLNGAVMVGAGTLLAVGRFRRLAAVALIGSILPTTYAGHRFWEETDEERKVQQKIHFWKNMGLLGGLILAAVDTEGQPSIAWPAHRKARRAGLTVSARRMRAGELANRAGTSNRAARREAAAGVREAGAWLARRTSAEPLVSNSVRRAGDIWSHATEHLPAG